MRTDSVRIAQSALDDVRNWIGKNYANELPEEAIAYATDKSAQDAHECIRPTYVEYTPDSIRISLSVVQRQRDSIVWGGAV